MIYCYFGTICYYAKKSEMSGDGVEKKGTPNIYPTSPCLMARQSRPPVEDIDYSNWSEDGDTSEDEKNCVSLEEFRSKAKETKEDLKIALGLEGSLREGDEQVVYHSY